jgi:chemotaxis protein MotB
MTASEFRPVLIGTLSAILISGCVSSSKYKKLEADKNEQISALQTQATNCETQRAACEKDKADIAAQKEAVEKSSAHTESQYNAIVGQLADEVQKGELKVTQYKNMLTVDVAEKIFFSSGSALLKDTGKQVLKKLAGALKDYPDKYIRVVGHTDNVPVSKATQATFASNWELSAIRATNVVRFLQDSGVPPERLVISARGQYQPIAANDTAEGRQKNRRIEIMLLDKSLVESVASK